MAFKRTLLSHFSLANPLYARATVTVYGVTAGGAKDTATKLTLYAAPTGSATLTNPQYLDSDGKWAQPVYVDAPAIMEITDLRVGSHDTGIVRPDIDDADLISAEYSATQALGASAAALQSARKADRSATAAAASAASIDDEQTALIAQSFG